MIRHPIYGCTIEGQLPGPLSVLCAGRLVGVAADMREAIVMAKQEYSRQSSVFDYSPSDRILPKG